MIDLSKFKLSTAKRRTIAAMPSSREWKPKAQMPGTTGSALSLLAASRDGLVERRWPPRVNGKRTEVSEYRLTELGVAVKEQIAKS